MTFLPDAIALSDATALHRKMGIEVTEMAAGRTVARMPVTGNTQPYGVLHGGASCLLAESAASLAAVAEVGEGGKAFGVDLNATHHLSARTGHVTAVATPLHVGGTLGTWEVAITNDAGDRVCTARVTLALRRPAR